MEMKFKLEKCELNEDNKCRNLLGALSYINSGTRPNISFSVNSSWFQSCYDETHFKYALSVLK